MATKTESSKPAPEAQLRSFIQKLDTKHQKLVRAVRSALRKRFPTANELVYDYSFALVIGYAPGDRGIDAIFAIRANAAGVSLYFSQGPKLSDPKRLLQGSGKQTRFITLESASRLTDPDIEAFIAATLKQARNSFPPDGKGSLIIKSDEATKSPRARLSK